MSYKEDKLFWANLSQCVNLTFKLENLFQLLSHLLTLICDLNLEPSHMILAHCTQTLSSDGEH